MYGWLGNYDLGIENNGELLTSGHPPRINYITSKNIQNLLEEVMTADDNLTFNATFVMPMEPSKCMAPPTDIGSTIIIILGIILGALSSIILLLIIILVSVCRGIRKSNQKKTKKYAC